MNSALAPVLIASGPHPSLGEAADTYARVIGSWRGELHNFMSEGAVPKTSIEAHFAWVLEGRAVQDVWITPARSDRARPSPSFDWYGTTLRVFDPSRGAWRAIWSDPVSQLQIEIEGRRQGDDIVQLGRRGSTVIRWTFSQIQSDSFLWQGHALRADGETWQEEVRIPFRRS